MKDWFCQHRGRTEVKVNKLEENGHFTFARGMPSLLHFSHTTGYA